MRNERGNDKNDDLLKNGCSISHHKEKEKSFQDKVMENIAMYECGLHDYRQRGASGEISNGCPLGQNQKSSERRASSTFRVADRRGCLDPTLHRCIRLPNLECAWIRLTVTCIVYHSHIDSGQCGAGHHRVFTRVPRPGLGRMPVTRWEQAENIQIGSQKKKHLYNPHFAREPGQGRSHNHHYITTLHPHS